MRRALLFSTLVLVCGVSCRPDFGERASDVAALRVLAIRAEPPEAAPGIDRVTYTLIAAAPTGAVESPAASFAFCTSPKLLTENGAVSAACLSSEGAAPIGDARGSITAVVPPDACFTFGPETKAQDVRPRDPDVTGGFFQPIRATISSPDGPVVAFGFERLRCKLANAPADAVQAFERDYRPNANPTLLPLSASIDGAPVAFDALPRGARVVLRASWRPEDAEAYVAFDPRVQAVVPRRESMRVSWFATAGSFEHDRTGRGEDEPESFTEDAWTAPDAEAATIWAVLRDARGGVAFAVQPVRTR
jgi:hypothetical protein